MRKVITIAPKIQREPSYDGQSILTSPYVQTAGILNGVESSQ